MVQTSKHLDVVESWIELNVRDTGHSDAEQHVPGETLGRTNFLKIITKPGVHFKALGLLNS